MSQEKKKRSGIKEDKMREDESVKYLTRVKRHSSFQCSE